MRFDPERHHRRSIRWRGYDYGGPGAYFVTICCHWREMLFGQVVAGRMVLNELGRIVEEEWRKSGEMRPYLGLIAHVVMPNHVHGVVVDMGDETEESVRSVENDDERVVGSAAVGLRRPTRSLGSFVAGFMAVTTRRINEARGLPGTSIWQRNYYEHVIRDEGDMARVVNYVLTNPVRWMLDRENPDRWEEDEFEWWLASGVEPGASGR